MVLVDVGQHLKELGHKLPAVAHGGLQHELIAVVRAHELHDGRKRLCCLQHRRQQLRRARQALAAIGAAQLQQRLLR